MNKREIIILFLAFGVCVFGVINYLFLSQKPGSGPQAQIDRERSRAKDFKVVSMAQLQKMKNTIHNPHLAYHFTMIQSEWAADPFVKNKTQKEDEETLDDNQAKENMPDIRYTGFIRAGAHVMAVINGMEYTVGEIIKEIGYKVFSISPKTVKLLTGKNQEIVITIEDN